MAAHAPTLEALRLPAGPLLAAVDQTAHDRGVSVDDDPDYLRDVVDGLLKDSEEIALMPGDTITIGPHRLKARVPCVVSRTEVDALAEALTATDSTGAR